MAGDTTCNGCLYSRHTSHLPSPSGLRVRDAVADIGQHLFHEIVDTLQGFGFSVLHEENALISVHRLVAVGSDLTFVRLPPRRLKSPYPRGSSVVASDFA
jgi:hypothetical protein